MKKVYLVGALLASLIYGSYTVNASSPLPLIEEVVNTYQSLLEVKKTTSKWVIVRATPTFIPSPTVIPTVIPTSTPKPVENTGSMLSQDTYNLAGIIEGEAPSEICSLEAQIAVAWVYSRNRRMNGWKEPTLQSIWVANNWLTQKDYAYGSTYIFSNNDIQLESVKSLLKSIGYNDVYQGIYYPCAHGLGLWVYP